VVSLTETNQDGTSTTENLPGSDDGGITNYIDAYYYYHSIWFFSSDV